MAAEQLQRLTVGELRQRCASLGIDPARVEMARDAGDPKAELMSLVLEHAPAPVGANELAGLTVGELRQRCASLGIDPA
eukprot:COSAG02_NODE_14753_length_1239_cov_3.388596_1_plen_78_part_01